MMPEFDALLEGLSLKTLGLRFCNLKALPNAVVDHTSLRRLAVRDCCLAQLYDGPYMDELKHLDLRGNCFETVL